MNKPTDETMADQTRDRAADLHQRITAALADPVADQIVRSAISAYADQPGGVSSQCPVSELATLHALAEECSAHALAWDQADDPDGHAAAWDALHTLLTAAGASVEHLARVRPDLAPVAAEDIAAAYRRLAAHLTAHLTVAEGDHHA
ncbi:MAG TPA: hypothetical protein VKZ67_00960 [Natronosporangium sp.]|nr:hypothetical protein [Natronosporangium sp.]